MPAMRLFRLRFTVRGMMVVVAILAVLTASGAPEISRRWRACQAAASRQEKSAEMWSSSAAMCARFTPRSKEVAQGAARCLEKAALHREMSRMDRWAFLDPFHECVLDQDIY
jgi:Tfp pilus assembly protein FimT